MAITLEQAKKLQPGQVLYHVCHRMCDGSPEPWHVNGEVKTWKRTPDSVDIPLKCGLHLYDHLTEYGLHRFCLTEAEAKRGLYRYR